MKQFSCLNALTARTWKTVHDIHREFEEVTACRSYLGGRAHGRLLDHPIEPKIGMRMEPPRSVAAGYEDLFLTSPDCLMTVRKVDANRAFDEEERGLGRLSFVFHLGGQRAVDVSGFGSYSLQGPTFGVQYMPVGATKTSTWTGGDHVTMVVVGFWIDRLPTIVRDVLRKNPSLSTLGHSRDTDPIAFSNALTIEMEQAARQVFYTDIHPTILPHYVASKANELISLALDALIRPTEQPRTDDMDVTDQLRYAREILMRDLQEPPTVKALAQAIDMPVRTLTTKFRSTYGSSIPKFISQERLKKAYHAIVTTDAPLKTIGYDVGYQHTSNFCSAFKEHFGKTPKETKLAAKRMARHRRSDRSGVAK